MKDFFSIGFNGVVVAGFVIFIHRKEPLSSTCLGKTCLKQGIREATARKVPWPFSWS